MEQGAGNRERKGTNGASPSSRAPAGKTDRGTAHPVLRGSKLRETGAGGVRLGGGSGGWLPLAS